MNCCNSKYKSNKAKVIKGRLCYCFEYSEDDLRDAVAQGRESSLINDIKSKMKDPGCFCENSNPLGKCCLGDINKFINSPKK